MEGGPPSSCLQRGAPCHGIIGIMVNPPLCIYRCFLVSRDVLGRIAGIAWMLFIARVVKISRQNWSVRRRPKYFGLGLDLVAFKRHCVSTKSLYFEPG